MKTNSDQINRLEKELGDFKTQLLVLNEKVQNVNKDLESMYLWIQGVGIAIIAGALLWFGQNAFGSHSV
jgi:hypothetical protein